MTKILQLKISVEGITPKIWRRFLVKDNISFNSLHDIIQIVMGWDDYHMHEFQIGDTKITSDEEGHNAAEASFKKLFSSPEFIKMMETGELKNNSLINTDKINKILESAEKNKPENKYNVESVISELINARWQEFSYLYDFGDNWVHSLIVENILEESKIQQIPACLAGERSCPPEDCGSIDGYEELMRIRKNKKHPRYKEMVVGWLGEDYDPEFFDAEQVNAMLQKMPSHANNKGKEEFVQLGKLLKKDNASVKKIKTLFKREAEYEDYLIEVEMAIAEYYLKNMKLKDKDAKAAIINIKKNYLEDIGFFKDGLEKDIMLNLSLALQDKSITHHELNLVFDYVLWCIENRSWVPDNQAFVKWLPYFFGLYGEREHKKYQQNFIKMARKMGVPQDQINGALEIGEDHTTEEQKSVAELDGEFFSLKDDEKYDFVVEHGTANPYFFSAYIQELDEKKDYRTIEKLCKQLMDLSDNFPMFEFLLGLNYENLQNPVLAEFHKKNAIKALEEAPQDRISGLERKNMLDEMKKCMLK